MAEIGRADLLIVPKFDGLTASVNRALGAAGSGASKSGQGIGQQAGAGFQRGFGASAGLAKSGALVGAFSAVTTKALDSITAHLGAAVSRFDTLNNYPLVMEQLGYSSEEAEASISKMSDRLQNLPTTLDSMASLTKGLVTVTGDLGKATDAGLALNDMLVASGSNQQLVTAAMEQFRQMLAKGKPEMEDWRSLTSAMPGQMDQLAKSMLGPTASVNDLYAALGGGKNDPTLTMDQLLDAMIRLDTQGGESFASFQKQAETAAGGIQTAVSNMGNAVTKGIAGVFDEVGKENIAGVFNDAKSAINEVFSAVQSGVGAAMPALQGVYGLVKEIGPEVAIAATSFVLLNKGIGLVSSAGSAVGGVLSTVGKLPEALKLAAGGAGTLAESFSAVGIGFSPVQLAIAAVTAALSIGAAVWSDYTEKQDNARAATEGLADVVGDTTALDGYSATLDDVGAKAEFSAMSVDELAESTAKHVDAMRQNTDEAETQIAQLNTAQAVLNEYAGQTDLTAQEQGKLEWALKLVNDQFGLSLTASDAASNSYKDQNGNVVNLKDSINDLIEAKKNEARTSALTANLTEAYQVEKDSADALAKAQKDYNNYIGRRMEMLPNLTRQQHEQEIADTGVAKTLKKATEQHDAAVQSTKRLEDELGQSTRAASEAADEYDRWSQSVGQLFSSQLEVAGNSISDFTEDLRSVGASTEDLSRLSQDELSQLAFAYDGTVNSIIPTLSDLGVGMDEARTKTVETAGGIAEVLNSVSGMGDVLSGAGASVADFALAAANAGLSAQDFAGVSASSFQALLDSCNGNLGAAMVMIGQYNSVPLVNKDGTVNVDQAQLWDAQGNVYTWNGTALVDKYGNAAVNSTQVVDATGNIWTYDGTQLVNKDAHAIVNGNAVTGDAQRGVNDTSGAVSALKSKDVSVNATGSASDGSAAKNIWNTVSAIGSLVGKTVTNFVNTVFSEKHNAAGGIRPHADGGIRYHAGGSIVNRPGAGVPLDIVGEDGAEAIIPLTNKRYSEPFARTLAEQMQKVGRQQVTTNIRIDGITYDDGSNVAEAMQRLVRALRIERRR